MSLFEHSPAPDWSLERWRTAAGKPSTSDLIEIGLSIGDVEFVREAVARWRAGTVQTWLNGSIARRDDARAMIAVLREASRRAGLPLFDAARFRAHADVFMASKACRDGGFTPLDEDELSAIAGQPVPPVDPRYDDADLLRKVYPPPPVTPFGREREILDLLGIIRDSVITVIVSDPGNGKTTLAWHAGRRAVTGGLVTAMDWNTDKRVMVTASGEARPIATAGPPLRFETIISSAVRRFGWDELRRAPDHQLPALAAKRLSEGRYLLVVDNLETVPQASEMVTALRGLLEPRGAFAPLTSRAVITSRVPVEDVPGVRHVRIGGLDLEPSAVLVRALEADGDFAMRCTDSEIEQLWSLTKGNPLLLQIAITRCAQQNGGLDGVLRDLDHGAGFMAVFDRVFGPLVETMTDENPKATYLAVYAALLPEQHIEQLQRAWDREYDDGEPGFQSALATVVRFGVLRPVPNAPGEFAIHPMIRLYLRHLHGG